MNIKIIPSVVMALSLGACATVPPPPHCTDSGHNLQPINPDMISQEQKDAVQAEARRQRQAHERLEQQRQRQGGGR